MAVGIYSGPGEERSGGFDDTVRTLMGKESIECEREVTRDQFPQRVTVPASLGKSLKRTHNVKYSMGNKEAGSVKTSLRRREREIFFIIIILHFVPGII